MLKEYVTVSIGVLTLLVAGVAAYGVVNTNTDIQTTQEPINIPDYSDEFKSLDYTDKLNLLSSQINDIKSDLSTLRDLKSDVSQIQQKLTALEEKSTVVAPQQALTLYLDKSTYQKGDSVKVTAFGVDPQKMVNIQILDDDFVIVSKEAWSDSTGKVLYLLDLSNALPAGNYEIRLVYGTKTTTEPIRVTDSNSNSVTIDQYTFTAQTDKSVYHRGEIIAVSGTGKPNTTISATMSSPSSKTFSTASSTQNDGTFTIFFPTTSSSEKGSWYITVNHVSRSIVVSITID